jgi:lauroyl/myristoyl acyltransferase
MTYNPARMGEVVGEIPLSLRRRSLLTAAPRAEGIVHRSRKAGARLAWRMSDIGILLGLATVAARVPLLTSRKALQRNARLIRTALGDAGRRRAEAIVQDLKSAVYEMRMQDLRSWWPGGWHPRMNLEGQNHLESALALGKGAILWVAPFVFISGPTKIALYQAGHRVSHLSSLQHGSSETRFGVRYLNRVRCIPEDRYLTERVVFDRNAPSTAMRRMMRTLKAGDIVSIVAASTEGSDVVRGPVFGGRILMAVGAPRLAGLTGAPLLPLFTVCDPKAGLRIVIDAPITLDPAKSAEQRCVAAAGEFLRRSEPRVRRYPEQWRAWSKWRQ